MIGIHRTPSHKMLRLLGRRPALNVTDALVARAQQWTAEQKLTTLYVCPLSGDGGSLEARLAALGFQREAARATDSDAARLSLGHLDLRDRVCEEAALMAYHPPRGPGRPRDEL
jgi:hypothetical protein